MAIKKSANTAMTRKNIPAINAPDDRPNAKTSLKSLAWPSNLPWFQGLALSATLAEKFSALGIHSPQNLLLHLPHRYEDLSHITPLKEAREGEEAQFEAMVRHVSTRGFGGKKQYLVQVTDGSADALLRFFNLYPAGAQALIAGAQIRFYGTMKLNFTTREFNHPRWSLLERAGALKNELSPVYPLTAGLSQTTLARQINRVMEKMPEEIMPMILANDGRYPLLKNALRDLHYPPINVSTEILNSPHYPPRARCKRDELLALQLLLRRLKERTQQTRALPLPRPNHADHLVTQLINRLPFTLTPAQIKVGQEIAEDMSKKHPMARLLQGDVGSGKTIVALLACLQAMDCGHQAVLMAPTEILAEQHYERFSALLRPLNINVGWLSATVGKKEREELAHLVRHKMINLVVGTHALIEDTLSFPSLALVVIDEQHRFGVHQRLRLHERGEATIHPHQLMMSATPIPRTLAMSHYAHLDVSVIDTLPAGRRPIRTRLVSIERREAIYRFIDNTLNDGHQVYWICPLIEESDTLQLQTATQTHERLIADLPQHAPNISLLHGRMNHEEKHAVMREFSQGRKKILVSTTVVEVGVDVPNASVMVIENAERFGLAQLHQLRGRIGRGTAESSCILLFQEPLTDTAKARLKVMYEKTDGFDIAAEDLRLRGPGEIIGSAQSGLPPLRFANLAEDLHLLKNARDLAPILLRDYPDIAQHLIDFWMPQARELERHYWA